MIAPSDLNFDPAPVQTVSKRDFASPRQLRALQLGLGWFPENPGGLDRYYFDLLNRFPAAGVQVRGLVCGSPVVQSQSMGTVRSAASASTPMAKRLLAFRKAFRLEMADFEPDVIGAHFALYAFPVLGSLKGKPLVMHFHGPWHKESKLEGVGRLSCWARYQAERAVYRRADRLVTLSEFFKRELIRSFKIDESRIEVIPGGVDCRRFDVNESRAQAREQLGWPADRPILLTVRRLTRRMGLENVIDACALIREKCPDALLHIAGSGKLKDELQAKIDAMGLQDHVRLLGFLPDEDLPLAYRAADVSIVPSLTLEGFGLVAAESLAAGTPVIATPVGGLPEIICPFRPELLARGIAAKHLADVVIPALLDLQRLPDRAECMLYAERYDWSTVSMALREVFASVI
jgi:glycosyltransferase involved in cell wall biosynthesis